MTRRTRVIVSGMLAVVIVAVGAYLFQPWRLFTSTEVNEALPPVASAPAPTAAPSASPFASAEPSSIVPDTPPAAEPAYTDLATGTFITHEHETSGTVRIVQQPDGSRVVAISGLQTSDGPDLRVWLTDQPVIEGTPGWGVFDDGQWVEVGALKGNVGDQVYEIPTDVDLASMRSISIWCARFAVSFGAAALEPT